MEIRKATLKELKQVKVIDEILFAKDSYPLFVLRQMFDLPGSILYVVLLQDKIVGYTLGNCCVDAGTAWFLSLGVLPEARGRGLGELLLKSLICEVESRGIKKMYLTVHPDNKVGISLYKKFGFAISGTDENYYLDGEPRLVMFCLLA